MRGLRLERSNHFSLDLPGVWTGEERVMLVRLKSLHTCISIYQTYQVLSHYHHSYYNFIYLLILQLFKFVF